MAVGSSCAPATNRVRADRPAVGPGGNSATAGLDLEGVDRSVVPGNDFFAYANGGWIKSHEIPPDRSSYGPAAILTELTARRTADLIADSAGAAAPSGSDAQKVGGFLDVQGRG
jgi:putative endopeptidase